MKNFFMRNERITSYSKHHGKASVIILTLLIAAALAGFWLLPSSAENSVTEISTLQELQAFRDSVNSGDSYAGKTVKLTADIDLGGSNDNQWTPIGSDDTKPFSGVFDGGGYKISGLYISDDQKSYQGLFGYVSGASAEIRDLTVSGDISANKYTGCIVGYNAGTISNCTATGAVSGNSDIGGIVGNNIDKGTVSNCTSACTFSGDSSIGGIVGYNAGTISNCTSTGTVSGDNRIGGIVGDNYGLVSNCTSSGNVSAQYNVGGIVGQNNNSIVTNCTSSSNVSGNETVGGIVGSNSDSNGTVTTSNCAFTGSVSDGQCVGRIVGINYKSGVTNCGWLGTAFSGAGIGYNLGTSTNVVSFDIASKDNVAVACLASPISLAVTKNGTSTVSLDLAPYASADFSKYVSINALSLDESIATAVSGDRSISVTGVDYGTAKLTISATLHPTFFSGDLTGISSDVPISLDVMITVYPPLTSVSLNVSELKLEVGNTEPLTATVLPKGAPGSAVTWKSSNEAVATVDAAGNVTAVKEGTAIITATTKGMDKNGSKLSDSCTVTVTPAGSGGPTSSGSSGGCSAGVGALALLAALPFVLNARKRRK